MYYRNDLTAYEAAQLLKLMPCDPDQLVGQFRQDMITNGFVEGNSEGKMVLTQRGRDAVKRATSDPAGR